MACRILVPRPGVGPTLPELETYSLLLLLLFFKRGIYLLVVVGLPCCGWAFSSRRGLLQSFSAWAFHCGGFSCCGAPGSRHTGFRSCGAPALLLGGIWDLSGAGAKPVSLALQSEVISTGPGGKSPRTFLYFHVFLSLACWVFMCLVYASWWQDGNV